MDNQTGLAFLSSVLDKMSYRVRFGSAEPNIVTCSRQLDRHRRRSSTQIANERMLHNRPE
jgi:hypothetical protein